MKKYVIGFIIGVALAVVAGSIYLDWKTRDLQRQNVQMKHDWDVSKAQYLAHDKERQGQIDAALTIVQNLQGNIDSLNFENAKLTEQVAGQDHAIAGLEEENKKLKTKEVDALIAANPDLKKYVDNLLSQISKNKEEVFTLKEKVKNAEDRAASSEGKFRALEIAFGKCTDDNLELKGLVKKANETIDSQALTIVSLGKKSAVNGIFKTTGIAGGVAIIAAVAILVLHR